MPKKTKNSNKRTLFDHLSRLDLATAQRLLGPNGKTLIIDGGKIEPNPQESAQLTEDAFTFHHSVFRGVTVSITLNLTKKNKLKISCDSKSCEGNACIHQGAALSCILEEKTALGLAAEPEEYTPLESLDEETLIAQAIAERELRSKEEKMRVLSQDTATPWTDYFVDSAASGKRYRVALRGFAPGQSYCTCPDFRKNTLGTCKHILNVSRKMRKKFTAKILKKAWVPKGFAICLAYGEALSLRLEMPPAAKLSKAETNATKRFRDKLITSSTDTVALLGAVQKLDRLGHEVTIYPDAEDFITRVLHERQVSTKMGIIRENPETHPLRTKLLKVDLLPYQLDGIAFATAAGRAVLADDMGLGKTIQGIGTAEMLRREAGISRVLVISPASLKSQWALEIEKFSEHTANIVAGAMADRATQYANDEHLFTLCNYEQVLRDITAIEPIPWDLIILDEGQRIKNWEAKTSRMVKALRSPYALVLTGTPLENRLDDLFSIIEFLDDRRLGPAFRFFHRHRITDEKGKVEGYKDLASLREKLSPILLRRTRASVLGELPPRTTEIVRIPPTAEQLEFNNGQLQIISSIVGKSYLTEMDLIRLQKALLMARMNADSTFLVTKDEPSYSTKLERLTEILEQLATEPDRKTVLFSEWTTMLDLIQPILDRVGIEYVRLDGSVPQKKRQALVNKFQKEPTCRMFLATNAGSTGLNLQAANTIINVDLPWNPAILEQRIGRAHRMGQKRPVHVYVLVTEETIEEGMLETLSAKHELAQAALDPDSDVDTIDLTSGMEALKRRLEILLGAAPTAAEDRSEQTRVANEAKSERLSEAGGQLLTAAFQFLSEMLPASGQPAAENPATTAIRESLRSCMETGEDGKPRLTITMPNESALDNLAATLGQIVASRE